MDYSEYDDGSDSAEDRRTRHVRINEIVETIVPTDGFEALNNFPGSNRPSRPNLNVPLGNRTIQYTQHSNFEAPNTQLKARGHSTMRLHQDEEIDLNLILVFYLSQVQVIVHIEEGALWCLKKTTLVT